MFGERLSRDRRTSGRASADEKTREQAFPGGSDCKHAKLSGRFTYRGIDLDTRSSAATNTDIAPLPRLVNSSKGDIEE
jgi:hypothetical protein